MYSLTCIYVYKIYLITCWPLRYREQRASEGNNRRVGTSRAYTDRRAFHHCLYYHSYGIRIVYTLFTKNV